ncbi:hypothetical protein ABZP36_002489 [Zizania latifolia]
MATYVKGTNATGEGRGGAGRAKTISHGGDRGAAAAAAVLTPTPDLLGGVVVVVEIFLVTPPFAGTTGLLPHSWLCRRRVVHMDGAMVMGGGRGGDRRRALCDGQTWR